MDSSISKGSFPDEEDDLGLQHNRNNVNAGQREDIKIAIEKALAGMQELKRVGSSNVGTTNYLETEIVDQDECDSMIYGENRDSGINLSGLSKPVGVAHNVQFDTDHQYGYVAATAEEIRLGHEISVNDCDSVVRKDFIDNNESFMIDSDVFGSDDVSTEEVLDDLENREQIEHLSISSLDDTIKLNYGISCSNNTRNDSVEELPLSSKYSSIHNLKEDCRALVKPVKNSLKNSNVKREEKISNLISFNTNVLQTKNTGETDSLKCFFESFNPNLVDVEKNDSLKVAHAPSYLPPENNSLSECKMPVLVNENDVVISPSEDDRPPPELTPENIVVSEQVIGVVHPFNHENNINIDNQACNISGVSIFSNKRKPLNPPTEVITRNRLRSHCLDSVTNVPRSMIKKQESFRSVILKNDGIKNMAVPTKLNSVVDKPDYINKDKRQGISSGNHYRMSRTGIKHLSNEELKDVSEPSIDIRTPVTAQIHSINKGPVELEFSSNKFNSEAAYEGEGGKSLNIENDFIPKGLPLLSDDQKKIVLGNQGVIENSDKNSINTAVCDTKSNKVEANKKKKGNSSKKTSTLPSLPILLSSNEETQPLKTNKGGTSRKSDRKNINRTSTPSCSTATRLRSFQRLPFEEFSLPPEPVKKNGPKQEFKSKPRKPLSSGTVLNDNTLFSVKQDRPDNTKTVGIGEFEPQSELNSNSGIAYFPIRSEVDENVIKSTMKDDFNKKRFNHVIAKDIHSPDLISSSLETLTIETKETDSSYKAFDNILTELDLVKEPTNAIDESVHSLDPFIKDIHPTSDILEVLPDADILDEGIADKEIIISSAEVSILKNNMLEETQEPTLEDGTFSTILNFFDKDLNPKVIESQQNESSDNPEKFLEKNNLSFSITETKFEEDKDTLVGPKITTNVNDEGSFIEKNKLFHSREVCSNPEMSEIDCLIPTSDTEHKKIKSEVVDRCVPLINRKVFPFTIPPEQKECDDSRNNLLSEIEKIDRILDKELLNCVGDEIISDKVPPNSSTNSTTAVVEENLSVDVTGTANIIVEENFKKITLHEKSKLTKDCASESSEVKEGSRDDLANCEIGKLQPEERSGPTEHNEIDDNYSLELEYIKDSDVKNFKADMSDKIQKSDTTNHETKDDIYLEDISDGDFEIDEDFEDNKLPTRNNFSAGSNVPIIGEKTVYKINTNVGDSSHCNRNVPIDLHQNKVSKFHSSSNNKFLKDSSSFNTSAYKNHNNNRRKYVKQSCVSSSHRKRTRVSKKHQDFNQSNSLKRGSILASPLKEEQGLISVTGKKHISGKQFGTNFSVVNKKPVASDELIVISNGEKRDDNDIPCRRHKTFIINTQDNICKRMQEDKASFSNENNKDIMGLSNLELRNNLPDTGISPQSNSVNKNRNDYTIPGGLTSKNDIELSSKANIEFVDVLRRHVKKSPQYNKRNELKEKKARLEDKIKKIKSELSAGDEHIDKWLGGKNKGDVKVLKSGETGFTKPETSDSILSFSPKIETEIIHDNLDAQLEMELSSDKNHSTFCKSEFLVVKKAEKNVSDSALTNDQNLSVSNKYETHFVTTGPIDESKETDNFTNDQNHNCDEKEIISSEKNNILFTLSTEVSEDAHDSVSMKIQENRNYIENKPESEALMVNSLITTGTLINEMNTKESEFNVKDINSTKANENFESPVFNVCPSEINKVTNQYMDVNQRNKECVAESRKDIFVTEANKEKYRELKSVTAIECQKVKDKCSSNPKSKFETENISFTTFDQANTKKNKEVEDSSMLNNLGDGVQKSVKTVIEENILQTLESSLQVFNEPKIDKRIDLELVNSQKNISSSLTDCKNLADDSVKPSSNFSDTNLADEKSKLKNCKNTYENDQVTDQPLNLEKNDFIVSDSENCKSEIVTTDQMVYETDTSETNDVHDTLVDNENKGYVIVKTDNPSCLANKAKTNGRQDGIFDYENDANANIVGNLPCKNIETDNEISDDAIKENENPPCNDNFPTYGENVNKKPDNQSCPKDVTDETDTRQGGFLNVNLDDRSENISRIESVPTYDENLTNIADETDYSPSKESVPTYSENVSNATIKTNEQATRDNDEVFDTEKSLAETLLSLQCIKDGTDLPGTTKFNEKTFGDTVHSNKPQGIESLAVCNDGKYIFVSEKIFIKCEKSGNDNVNITETTNQNINNSETSESIESTCFGISEKESYRGDIEKTITKKLPCKENINVDTDVMNVTRTTNTVVTICETCDLSKKSLLDSDEYVEKQQTVESLNLGVNSTSHTIKESNQVTNVTEIVETTGNVFVTNSEEKGNSSPEKTFVENVLNVESASNDNNNINIIDKTCSVDNEFPKKLLGSESNLQSLPDDKCNINTTEKIYLEKTNETFKIEIVNETHSSDDKCNNTIEKSLCVESINCTVTYDGSNSNVSKKAFTENMVKQFCIPTPKPFLNDEEKNVSCPLENSSLRETSDDKESVTENVAVVSTDDNRVVLLNEIESHHCLTSETASSTVTAYEEIAINDSNVDVQDKSEKLDENIKLLDITKVSEIANKPKNIIQAKKRDKLKELCFESKTHPGGQNQGSLTFNETTSAIKSNNLKSVNKINEDLTNSLSKVSRRNDEKGIETICSIKTLEESTILSSSNVFKEEGYDVAGTANAITLGLGNLQNSCSFLPMSSSGTFVPEKPLESSDNVVVAENQYSISVESVNDKLSSEIILPSKHSNPVDGKVSLIINEDSSENVDEATRSTDYSELTNGGIIKFIHSPDKISQVNNNPENFIQEFTKYIDLNNRFISDNVEEEKSQCMLETKANLATSNYDQYDAVKTSANSLESIIKENNIKETILGNFKAEVNSLDQNIIPSPYCPSVDESKNLLGTVDSNLSNNIIEKLNECSAIDIGSSKNEVDHHQTDVFKESETLKDNGDLTVHNNELETSILNENLVPSENKPNICNDAESIGTSIDNQVPSQSEFVNLIPPFSGSTELEGSTLHDVNTNEKNGPSGPFTKADESFTESSNYPSDDDLEVEVQSEQNMANLNKEENIVSRSNKNLCSHNQNNLISDDIDPRIKPEMSVDSSVISEHNAVIIRSNNASSSSEKLVEQNACKSSQSNSTGSEPSKPERPVKDSKSANKNLSPIKKSDAKRGESPSDVIVANYFHSTVQVKKTYSKTPLKKTSVKKTIIDVFNKKDTGNFSIHSSNLEKGQRVIYKNKALLNVKEDGLISSSRDQNNEAANKQKCHKPKNVNKGELKNPLTTENNKAFKNKRHHDSSSCGLEVNEIVETNHVNSVLSKASKEPQEKVILTKEVKIVLERLDLSNYFSNIRSGNKIERKLMGHNESVKRTGQRTSGQEELPYKKLLLSHTSNIDEDYKAKLINVVPSSNIETTLKNLERPSSNTKTNLENLERPSSNIKTDLENLEGPSSNSKRTLKYLERPSSNIKTNLENLEGPSSNIKTNLENLEESSSNIKTNLRNLDWPSSNIKTNLKNLEGPSSKIKTNLKHLEEPSSNIKTNLKNLEKKKHQNVITDAKISNKFVETNCAESVSSKPTKKSSKKCVLTKELRVVLERLDTSNYYFDIESDHKKKRQLLGLNKSVKRTINKLSTKEEIPSKILFVQSPDTVDDVRFVNKNENEPEKINLRSSNTIIGKDNAGVNIEENIFPTSKRRRKSPSSRMDNISENKNNSSTENLGRTSHKRTKHNKGLDSIQSNLNFNNPSLIRKKNFKSTKGNRLSETLSIHERTITSSISVTASSGTRSHEVEINNCDNDFSNSHKPPKTLNYSAIKEPLFAHDSPFRLAMGGLTAADDPVASCSSNPSSVLNVGVKMKEILYGVVRKRLNQVVEDTEDEDDSDDDFLGFEDKLPCGCSLVSNTRSRICAGNCFMERINVKLRYLNRTIKLFSKHPSLRRNQSFRTFRPSRQDLYEEQDYRRADEKIVSTPGASANAKPFRDPGICYMSMGIRRLKNKEESINLNQDSLANDLVTSKNVELPYYFDKLDNSNKSYHMNINEKSSAFHQVTNSKRLRRLDQIPETRPSLVTERDKNCEEDSGSSS